MSKRILVYMYVDDDIELAFSRWVYYLTKAIPVRPSIALVDIVSS